MAVAWRAVRPKYKSQIISGLGAANNPGRWNRPGEQMIYTASSQSLSMLELLPYMVSPFPLMTMGRIEIPDNQLEYLDLDEAEATDLLSDSRQSKNLGSGWLKSEESVALAVPSVHIHPSDWRREPNVLINPLHPEFNVVTVPGTFDFKYDDRLEE
jgi:RES domain-containing protein